MSLRHRHTAWHMTSLRKQCAIRETTQYKIVVVKSCQNKHPKVPSLHPKVEHVYCPRDLITKTHNYQLIPVSARSKAHHWTTKIFFTTFQHLANKFSIYFACSVISLMIFSLNFCTYIWNSSLTLVRNNLPHCQTFKTVQHFWLVYNKYSLNGVLTC